MKRILVPFDFTEYSGNALRYATYFAKVKGMEIKLLHIFEQSKKSLTSKFSKNETDENFYDDIRESTEEHIKRMVSLEQNNGINISYEIRPAKTSITKEILKEDCDVIIMGRRRRDSHDSVFVGSVAEKVIRFSPIPVITVGELPKVVSLNNIVFASDFEDDNVMQIITRVNDLARIFNANIHYAYVQLNRNLFTVSETQEKLYSLIDKFGLNHDVDIYFASTEEEGIEQAVEETKADLLVMCTHGRKGILHFLLGSVAEDMVAFSEIPVLTYNINPKKVDRASRTITRENLIRVRKTKAGTKNFR